MVDDSNNQLRGLLRTLVLLLVLGAIVAGLLAAVPGLAGVTHTLSHARAVAGLLAEAAGVRRRPRR